VNFLADECCDALIVAGLRGDGHDVLHVTEVAPGNAVLQMALAQRPMNHYSPVRGRLAETATCGCFPRQAATSLAGMDVSTSSNSRRSLSFPRCGSRSLVYCGPRSETRVTRRNICQS
jgi:hypothetical protein